MYKQLTALALGSAFVLAAGAARAAELPQSAAPAAACCAFSWTGFYIGAHGGYGIANVESSIHVDSPPQPFVFDDLSPKSGIFGVHGGYNIQRGRFLFGIEGDYSWARGSETHVTVVEPAEPDSLGTRARLNYLASLRGRAGLAIDRTLVYATAGVGFAGANWRATFADADSGTFDLSTNLRETGWVYGAGVEHAIGCCSGIVLRAEYLRYSFGGDKQIPPNSLNSGAPEGTIPGDHVTLNDVDVFRVGLSYKFGDRQEETNVPLK